MSFVGFTVNTILAEFDEFKLPSKPVKFTVSFLLKLAFGVYVTASRFGRVTLKGVAVCSTPLTSIFPFLGNEVNVK